MAGNPSSQSSPPPAENELAALIRQAIAEDDGLMPFNVFMGMALYHERLGYYTRGRQPTGREGDFYTSVSVGDLFGRLLALQVRQVWERLRQPRTFWIIEQGANDGRLAADILHALAVVPGARHPFVPQYLIVEPFPANQARQRERLNAEGLHDRVTWAPDLTTAATLTAAEDGVFLSNELVDSFPVHLVRYSHGRWHERLVRQAEGGGFAWEERPLPPGTSLAEAVAERAIPEIEGYLTEVNLGAETWMRQAGQLLRRGLWVTIDYGYPRPAYYDPGRKEGTLRTHRQHRRDDDPLDAPGLTDITAHVDFTALARAGEQVGLATLGFVDQHHFIMGLCADDFAHNRFPGSDAPPTPAQIRAFQTLSHPEMMGTSFHVLLQARDLPGREPLDGLRFARPVPGLL